MALMVILFKYLLGHTIIVFIPPPPHPRDTSVLGIHEV